MNAAVDCSDVVTKINVCQSYLIGYDPPTPSIRCCLAVQSLEHKASASRTARKAYCECVKHVENSTFINLYRLALLPESCSLKINIGVITPNFDCNRTGSREFEA
ncbi:hypothetical protein F0562_018821 [Nyssa sinensis]|uniref:Bifunctional inhibitor/plant lipid transfer protein/seed storage helical domain-containing protein n=1 Tax=Nyssa sinensis TaxID=561372 RepID=A0A5J4ZDG4_9ASTE|nr:hypothetical protein F0562_018821 [Nyssa sinensis]